MGGESQAHDEFSEISIDTTAPNHETAPTSETAPNSETALPSLVFQTIVVLTLSTLIFTKIFKNHFTFNHLKTLIITVFLPSSTTTVNCWFCNKDQQAQNPKKPDTPFTCKHCDQYNGFQRDGDYDKVISSHHYVVVF